MDLMNVLILATILYASYKLGHPIVARKERRKRYETWKEANQKAKDFYCQ